MKCLRIHVLVVEFISLDSISLEFKKFKDRQSGAYHLLPKIFKDLKRKSVDIGVLEFECGQVFQGAFFIVFAEMLGVNSNLLKSGLHCCLYCKDFNSKSQF